MDSISAFARGSAARAAGNEQKVFDWEKAAQLIKKHKPEKAIAGLESDFEWTGDTIYEDGKIKKDSSPYLSSNWANPLLVLDGDEFECYATESQLKKRGLQWDSGTVWPKSSLDILKKKKT